MALQLIQPEKKINEQIVKELADMLELAKEGKITAFAAVHLDDNDFFNYIYSKTTHMVSLVGAVARLQNVLHEKMNYDNKELVE